MVYNTHNIFKRRRLGELLLAAFLLRKSKQQKIFDRIEKMNSELAEF